MIRLLQARINVRSALVKKAEEEEAYEKRFAQEYSFEIRTAVQKHRNAVSDIINTYSRQALTEGEHIVAKNLIEHNHLDSRIAKLVCQTIKAELEGDGYTVEIIRGVSSYGLKFSWREDVERN